MDLYSVIKHPLITEKSLASAKENKYVFVVDRDATKEAIKEAIKKLFNVEVLVVSTVNYKGKRKRVRGKRRPVSGRDWKKAIVKLRAGQKIEVFEKEK